MSTATLCGIIVGVLIALGAYTLIKKLKGNKNIED